MVYLAYMTEPKTMKREIHDVEVVKEYSDVFLDELLGLPLDREVEFTNDLAPESNIIEWTPYWLAPSEMEELSNHLQEQIDQGFICPSSSPWGALILFVKKDVMMCICIYYRELNKITTKNR